MALTLEENKFLIESRALANKKHWSELLLLGVGCIMLILPIYEIFKTRVVENYSLVFFFLGGSILLSAHYMKLRRFDAEKFVTIIDKIQNKAA